MDALLKYELDELEEIKSTEEYSIKELMEVVGEENRFKIENIESANWAFRKLKAIEEREKEVNQLAEAEIQRIKDWQEKELSKFARSKEFFNFLLEEYYKEQKALDPSFKLSTPYGKVSSRKQQPKWNYDEDKLINWLKENNIDLVRVKYEPKKAEIKKTYKVVGNNVVTEDGEIVDGITIEEQPETILIKVEG